jgi:hypothetical protein
MPTSLISDKTVRYMLNNGYDLMAVNLSTHIFLDRAYAFYGADR